MSVEKVREYLKGYGMAERMQEFTVSSATVELAAVAVGVEPARIAKTWLCSPGASSANFPNFTISSTPRPRCSPRRRRWSASAMRWAECAPLPCRRM